MIQVALAALIAAVSACAAETRQPDEARQSATVVAENREAVPGVAKQSGTDSLVYEAVASDLEVPWAIAFAPDGRMFFTERPGRIRVMRDGTLEPRAWATLDVAAEGEAGLMGIALSPAFASDRHVFVCATLSERGRLVNRVLRYTDDGGRGVSPRVIVDDIPAAAFHAGDALGFGPDGMLYVATGDARDPGNASDARSLAGKILRYTPDGGIPSDNPSPGSPVYALGLRNVQGLAWDEGGALLAIDHGPSGFPNERFRRNNDELNVIRAGAHYGWPSVAGFTSRTRYANPLVVWNPAIAPGGLAVYSGPNAGMRGDVFVGALRGEHLRRIQLTSPVAQRGARRQVRREVVLFPELGRIRAVAMGPDGYLYFSTSNRDGRGVRRRNDDHIYRLRPQ